MAEPVRKSIGLGSAFAMKLATATTTTYVTIGGIVDSDGPAASGEAVPLPTLDSTDNFTPKLGGLVDGGDFSLNLAHSSTTPSRKQIGTALGDRLARTFKFTPPSTDETAESFDAIVTGLGRSLALNTMIVTPFTASVDGDPGFLTT